jgi:hypothetical protein
VALRPRLSPGVPLIKVRPVRHLTLRAGTDPVKRPRGKATDPIQPTPKFGMTWKPTDHVDEQVRGWMRARRWDVTATDYYSEQEVYSWRHQQPGGKSPTLRIARNVLEHNPAFVILYHLDRLNVAAPYRPTPETRLVVVEEA